VTQLSSPPRPATLPDSATDPAQATHPKSSVVPEPETLREVYRRCFFGLSVSVRIHPAWCRHLSIAVIIARNPFSVCNLSTVLLLLYIAVNKAVVLT